MKDTNDILTMLKKSNEILTKDIETLNNLFEYIILDSNNKSINKINNIVTELYKMFENANNGIYENSLGVSVNALKVYQTTINSFITNNKQDIGFEIQNIIKALNAKVKNNNDMMLWIRGE